MLHFRCLVLSLCLVTGHGVFAQSAPKFQFQATDHAGPVNGVTFTPDGRHVVSGGADQFVVVRDAATGQIIRKFQAHQGPVLGLSVSPDGRSLATTGQDAQLKLWDLPQTRPLNSYSGGGEADLGPLGLSPDGKWVLAASRDHDFYLWATQGSARTPHGGRPPGADASGSVQSVAWRNDANQFATADSTGFATVWLTHEQRPLLRLGAHTGSATGVVIHPNQQQLCTAGADGLLKLFQLNVPEPRGIFGHREAVNSLVIVGQNQFVLSGSADHSVRLSDFASGQLVREFLGMEAAVTTVANSPNAALVAAGDDSGAIRVWTLGDGLEQARIEGHAGAIRSLSFSADSLKLASAGADGTVRVWTLGVPRKAIDGHNALVHSLAMASNAHFVTASADKTVRFWNAQQQQIRQYAGHEPNEPLCLAVKTDFTQAVSGDGLGNLHIHNPADAATTKVLGAHSGPITAVSYHAVQQTLFSAGADGVIKSWQPTAAAVQPMAGHGDVVSTVALASEGRFAISSGPDQQVRIWELLNARHVRNLDGLTGPVHAVAYSTKTGLAAAAGEAGIIKFWNFADGADRGRIINLTGAISSLAFDATGERVATTDATGAVRVWSVPPATPKDWPGEKTQLLAMARSVDGQRLAHHGTKDGKHVVFLREFAGGTVVSQLAAQDGAITAIAFSGNGARLITGANDGFVRVWQVDNGTLLGEHKLGAGISAVALSNDGTIAYSTASEAVLHRWPVANPVNPADVKQLAGHTASINHLVADGDRIFSGSDDGTVRAWTAQAMEAVLTINHGAPITSLTLNTNAKLIASGANDKQVKLWNLADGAAGLTLTGPENAVIAVSFSLDGQQLVAADAAGCHVWRVGGRGLQRVLNAADVRGCCVFAPSGQSLVSRLPDNTLRETPLNLVADLVGQVGPCKGVRFALDGDRLISAGGDKSLRLWQWKTGQVLADLRGPKGDITGLDLSPDGKQLAATSADPAVSIWNLDKPAAAPRELALATVPRCVAFGREGKRLAIGGDDQQVRVIELESGIELERIGGHTGPVLSLAFHDDGRTLVTGSVDRTLRLHDLSCQAAFKAGGRMRSMQTLPQGFRVAAIIAGENQVRVWTTTGQPEKPFAGPQAELITSALTPTGEHLVAADVQGRLYFWTTNNSQLIRTVELGRQVGSGSLEFAPDGTRLAVSFDDNCTEIRSADGLRLLECLRDQLPTTHARFLPDGKSVITSGLHPSPNLHTLKLQRLLEAHPGGATVAHYFPSGELLLTAGNDGQVHLWNMADGQKARSYAGLTGPVRCAAISRDSRFVIAADDTSIKVWQQDNAQLLKTLSPIQPNEPEALAPGANATPAPVASAVGLADPTLALSINQDGSLITTSHPSGRVRVWDGITGLELEFWKRHAGGAPAVGLGLDNRSIISGGADGHIRVCTLAATKVAQADAGGVTKLALTPNGATLLTVGADKSMRSWDMNLTAGRVFEGATAALAAIAVRPDHQHVAAGGATGEVLIWNLGDGSLISKIPTPAPVQALAYAPNNLLLAILGGDQRLRVYGTTPVEQLQEITLPASGGDIAFTPDNRGILMTTASGTVQEWGFASSKEVRTFGGHGGPIYDVEFSTDGKKLISCSADQTARVWDVATGGALAGLGGHQGPVYSLSRSNDGALLVTAGADKTLRAWEVQGGRQLIDVSLGDTFATSVAWLSDGRTVIAACSDKQIRVVDMLSRKVLRTLKGHPDAINQLAVTPPAHQADPAAPGAHAFGSVRLASCGVSGRLFVWDLKTGKPTSEHRLREATQSIAWSPDAKRLVIGTAKGQIGIMGAE